MWSLQTLPFLCFTVSVIITGLLLIPWFFIPPRALLNLYKRRFRAPYVNKCTWYKEDEKKKRIALTIDDSPSISTCHILDCLEKYPGVRATFFVIGLYAKASPGILRELVCHREHETANHGWSTWAAAWYDWPTLEFGMSDTRTKLSDAYKAAGRSLADDWTRGPGSSGLSTWYRPGSGILTQDVIKACEWTTLKPVLGDIYPLDAHIPWPWLNAQYVLMHVQPGSVIILHDRLRTVRTLEILLPELERRGYEICTLSELFGKQ